MRILLCNPRGFCAGVNMAVNALEEAIRRFGGPVYVYHEIVHNTWVVEHFIRQGVRFVDRIDDVPEGATLLFSAHGVAPDIRNRARQRHLRTVDATCPLVNKVHQEVLRFAAEGRSVVLIGHAGHDEVVGIMGEAPDSISLVECREDVDRLDFSPEQARHSAYLTQTTLSGIEAEEIITALRRRFPEIVGPPASNICFATRNRQEAVRRFASEVDVVLVIGSRNSSNSRRLAEIAEAVGTCSYLIDGPDDISSGLFSGGETILVSAGASAPEEIVRRCVGILVERFGATVEERTVREENMNFLLPRELRDDA